MFSLTCRCDEKPFDKRSPWSPIRDKRLRNGEKMPKDVRRSWILIKKTLQSLRLESLYESQDFDLRGVRRRQEYKVMNQKSPDESGSSQNWKADMGFS